MNISNLHMLQICNDKRELGCKPYILDLFVMFETLHTLDQYIESSLKILINYHMRYKERNIHVTKRWQKFV